MKRVILSLIVLILITIAGIWLTNNFIIKPDIVARGQKEKQIDDCGLDLVDAHVGTAKTLTMNGSVEAGAHKFFSGSGSVALGGARKISDVLFASPPAAPENSLTTPVGSLFIKASGRAPHTYFKENRTGNSDWTAISVAGQDPDAEYLKRGEGDINSFNEKVKPSDANLSLIKESGAVYAKNKVQLNNLSGGGGGSGRLKLLGNPGYETLAYAKRTIGSNQATLVIPAGTINVTSDPALPSNIELLMMKGAMFNISANVTMTINGPFRAGNNRHFAFGSSTSKVRFGAGMEVNAVWFTNGGDGTSGNRWTGQDGQAGIGEAANHLYYSSTGTGGVTIYLPPGHYTNTQTIRIGIDGTFIKGPVSNLNWRETSSVTIYFNPAGPAPCFLFQSYDAGTMIQNCGMGGGIFITCASASFEQQAIKVVHGSVMNFYGITIGRSPWSVGWPGAGIEWWGKDMSLLEKLYIVARKPLHFRNNPDDSIDLDCIVVRTAWLECTDHVSSTAACVTIDDGVWSTGLKMDHWISFSGGRYGLYWNDTSNDQTNANIILRDFKYEGGNFTSDERTGWGVYISFTGSSKIQNLEMTNHWNEYNRGGGVYLRRTNNATLTNFEMYPAYGGLAGYKCIDVNGIENLTVTNLCSNESYSIGSMNTAMLVEAGGNETITFGVFTLNTPTVTVYGK